MMTRKSTESKYGANLKQTRKKSVQVSPKPEVRTGKEGRAHSATRSSPRCTSSTPSSMYEFKGESPQTDDNEVAGKKPRRAKTTTKSQKKDSKTSATKRVAGKQVKRVSKKSEMPGTAVTPRNQISKPIVLEKVDSEKSVKQSKRHRILKPIPPPNLEDISPIVNENKTVTPSRKRIAASKKSRDGEFIEKKRLRSSVGNASLESPSVSFLEPVEDTGSNDSAIFVSPRRTMPRFSVGKTSTPATSGVHKKTAANNKKNGKKISTGVSERKQTNTYTGIKKNISKVSPVKRLDTPTSDYGSMELSMTPPSSTSPVKHDRKKRGNSPAFTLEDDDSGEMISLNKSVDKSYKKSTSKKKYHSAGRLSTSKIDEWADKVNSELEDIENFELSVEG